MNVKIGVKKCISYFYFEIIDYICDVIKKIVTSLIIN